MDSNTKDTKEHEKLYRGLTRMSADRKTFNRRGRKGRKGRKENLTTDEHG